MIELLNTKLFIPRPRKNLVSRPHLIKRLNASLDKKLTLIAAPAGFGKTTLLSEWIPESPRCATWFSLDDGDNDPTKFWAYFIASLQRLQPDLGSSPLALLQSPQTPPITSIMTALINEIAAFPDIFAFVLDDYQNIESQPIHEALIFLIDHLPKNMHLIMTTRIDPPIPLARLRAHDQLTELRANDLRFEPEEAASFLTQVMGLNLTAAEVAMLDARIEGWIAGLQIAGLSMQGHQDIHGFIQAFSGGHRHILGYLADEVLNQQPKAALDFLLQTCILDQLCGPLCDALTGGSGGQSILEHLERANLFITPLDDESRWYRYHPLFAEVLRHRLKQVTALPNAEMVAASELHCRASAWFEREGLIDEAIQHALSAADIERAASLVERYSILMLQQSKVPIIRSWLQQLPDELVQSRTRLILAHGWTLVLTGHSQALEEWLADPQVCTALTAPDLPVDILGELSLLRATLARFQRQDAKSLSLAQQALEYLADDHRGLQAGAMYTIGVAHLRTGEMVSASQAFSEAVHLGETRGGLYMALGALEELSELQIRQGRLSLAIQSCQRAKQIVARSGREAMPADGLADIQIGRALYERNELNAAAIALSEGVDKLRSSIEQYILAQGHVALSRVQLAGGDGDAAFQTIERGEGWFNQMHIADTGAGTLLGLGKVQLAIYLDDLSAPDSWAQNCIWLSEDTQLGYLQAVTLVRLHLAQNRHQMHAQHLDKAAEMLDRLSAAAKEREWWGQVIELSVLRALLCQAQGKTAEVYTNLKRALSLAEPEGYLRSFVDEGEPMHRLLLDYKSKIKKSAGNGVESGSLRFPQYIDKLVNAFSQPALTEEPKKNTMIEPLSERELDILRLIATGRTNKEIAEILVIAVSTVKSHINSLYGKLGTHRRTQAIIIARDQGLLSG